MKRSLCILVAVLLGATAPAFGWEGKKPSSQVGSAADPRADIGMSLSNSSDKNHGNTGLTFKLSGKNAAGKSGGTNGHNNKSTCGTKC